MILGTAIQRILNHLLNEYWEGRLLLFLDTKNCLLCQTHLIIQSLANHLIIYKNNQDIIAMNPPTPHKIIT